MTGNRGNFLKGSVKRILVPVNFSSKCSLAMEHAVVVARVYGASIFVMHVVDSTILVAGGAPGVLNEVSSRAEIALEEMAAIVREQQIECMTILRQGPLDSQIQEVIAEYEIDVLILATRAGTALAGFSLASTAERILRKTMIPVLIVCECRPIRKWSGKGCINIFYATDLSPESIRSFEFAHAMQRRFCADFTLAHVSPKHAAPEKAEAARQQLYKLADGTTSKVEILQGPIGRAVCEASAKAGADLIVVGVHKHSVLREVLIGHNLLDILYGASCPVLTVRI